MSPDDTSPYCSSNGSYVEGSYVEASYVAESFYDYPVTISQTPLTHSYFRLLIVLFHPALPPLLLGFVPEVVHAQEQARTEN